MGELAVRVLHDAYGMDKNKQNRRLNNSMPSSDFKNLPARQVLVKSAIRVITKAS